MQSRIQFKDICYPYNKIPLELEILKSHEHVPLPYPIFTCLEIC